MAWTDVGTNGLAMDICHCTNAEDWTFSLLGCAMTRHPNPPSSFGPPDRTMVLSCASLVKKFIPLPGRCKGS